MAGVRFLALPLAMLTVAACAGPSSSTAEQGSALFYASSGSIYVSAPVGAPGRKLTDGPTDTDPAPSPDGGRLAYVHKADPADAGGELWVLDVSSGAAKRLVDPAALVPKFEGDRPQAGSPQWSPAGDRIAFLKAGTGGGGFLLTADASTGSVQPPATPLYADANFSWAPDGSRIAWVGGRSDVSPVDVNVLTVGGSSEAVVKDTNASSVSFGHDGRSVLFANGDATGDPFLDIPFDMRDGGIYGVEIPRTEGPGGAAPKQLLFGKMPFADVQALSSGAVGFTEWSADQRTKTIQVSDTDRKTHRVAETRGDAPHPIWNDEESVAYVGTAEDRPLLVAHQEGAATTVAGGVEAFAWGTYTGG
ncbi:MAG: PD40 domain-containing protein [Mycobacterium sp.]|nr:PD40 domain-containing protein [Mycobacterium sp.]